MCAERIVVGLGSIYIVAAVVSLEGIHNHRSRLLRSETALTHLSTGQDANLVSIGSGITLGGDLVTDDDPWRDARCWTKHQDCVMTFVHQGQTYSGCTDAENPGVFWCSTMEVGDPSDWDMTTSKRFCTLLNPCELRNDILDSQFSAYAGMNLVGTWPNLRDDLYDTLSACKGECVKLDCPGFVFVDKPATKCSFPGSPLHSPTARDGTGKTTYIRQAHADTRKICWQLDSKCKREFMYQGSVVQGCTKLLSHLTPWCYDESVYEEAMNSSDHSDHHISCRQASCESCQNCQDEYAINANKDCWLRHPACDNSFINDGITYVGCMSGGDGKGYCAESAYGKSSPNWHLCKHCSEQVVSEPVKIIAQWVDVEASNLAGDQKVEALCPAGFTMTGCTCYSADGYCAGSRIEGNRCSAIPKNLQSQDDVLPVAAVARCLHLPNFYTDDWADVENVSRVGKGRVVSSSVLCPADFEVMSCFCFSTDGACRDVAVVDGRCVVTSFGDTFASNVYARARCLRKDDIVSKLYMEEIQSKAENLNFSAATTFFASCPSDKILTGCTCSSQDGACAGAKAHGNSCVATSRVYGKPVTSRALCGTLKRERWCHHYLVLSAGMKEIVGEYYIDQESLNRDAPIWRLDSTYTLMLVGAQWEIVKDARVILYTLPVVENSDNVSAQWRVAGDARAPPPVVSCGRAQADGCWTPDPRCISTFSYKGLTHANCTAKDVGTSGKPWCAMTQTVVEPRTQGQPCIADTFCKSQSRWSQADIVGRDCYVPPSTCKASFVYKGKLVQGCAHPGTVDGKGDYWCSREDTFVDVMPRIPCVKTVCKEGPLQNVALGKPVASSGDIDGSRRSAAVDGNNGDGQLVVDGACAATPALSRLATRNFIRIDLEAVYTVKFVTLVGRVSEYDRADANWQITLGEGTRTDPVCANDVRPFTNGPLDVKCMSALKGRFLTVWSTDAITLCELEAHASKCWRPHRDCVSSFASADNPTIIHGCFLSKYEKPWCSQDEIFAGNWKLCEEVNCEEVTPEIVGESCMQPHQLCVPEWSYGGVLYKGCSDGIRSHRDRLGERFWCSGNLTYDGYLYPCSEVLCPNCHLRAPECQSTFLYEGISYDGCTDFSSSEFWCSTISTFRGAADTRRTCSSCPPKKNVIAAAKGEFIDGWPSDPVCWKQARGCLSSFTFENRTTYGCSNQRHTFPWCSKTDPYDGAYSECEPCPECFKPHPSCVEAFLYQGEMRRGCVVEGTTTPWCSSDLHLVMPVLCSQCLSEQETLQREITETTAAPSVTKQGLDCYELASLCVGSFDYKGVRHAGCARNASGSYWCSHQASFVDGLTERSDCAKTLCSSFSTALPGNMCYMPAKACAPVFKYKAITYQGCTDVDRAGIFWCANTALYNDVAGWSTCELKPCSDPTSEESTAIDTYGKVEFCNLPSPGCVSSFSVNGINVEGCTMVNAKQPWCSMDAIYDGRKGNCTALPCQSCWVPAPACEQTFVYNGQIVQGCTNEASDIYWCSIDKKYIEGVSEWQACTPCSKYGGVVARAADDCVDPAPECKPNFMYKGVEYHGCTNVDSKVWWCGTSNEVDEHSLNWKPCQTCNDVPQINQGPFCHRPHQDCVGHFVYNGKNYRGCTSLDSNSSWCSKTRYHGGPTERLPCESVACDSCWVLDNECVNNFTIQGELFRGCVYDSHLDNHWCSTDYEYTLSSKWASCMPCGRTDASGNALCHQPDKACVSDFIYNGMKHEGCIRTGSDKHWCSTVDVLGEFSEEKTKYCSEALCEACWIRGPRCKSSFVYKGEVIVGCTKRDYDAAWCSADEEFREGVSTRELCKPCKSEVVSDVVVKKAVPVEEKCHKLHPACVREFDFQGLTITGCTDLLQTNIWCSNVTVNSGSKSERLTCEELECRKCYEPAPKCKKAFMYNGSKVEGCMYSNSMWWCSEDDVFVAATSKWSKCNPCEEAKEKCWQPAVGCVDEFRYKLKQYSKCARIKDDGLHYCSVDATVQNFEAYSLRVCQERPCLDLEKLRARSIDICYQPDNQCEPVFTYRGEQFRGCTQKDSAETQWCSQSAVVMVDTPVLQCKPVPCDKCFIRAAVCKPSFTYQGTRYSGCVELDGMLPRCSLASTWQSEDDWALCSPCENIASNGNLSQNQLCDRPSSSCLLDFQIGTEKVRGCTTKASLDGKAWCSKERDQSPLQRNAEGVGTCDRVPCDECWIKDDRCVERFTYAGMTVEGCSNKHVGKGDNWWCSLQEDFTKGNSSWLPCQPCQKQQHEGVAVAEKKRCWVPPTSCANSFSVDGRRGAGCLIDEATSKGWCPRVQNFVSSDPKPPRSWCEMTPCSNLCWILHASCKQSFEYNGKLHSGCVEEEGHIPWCSKEELFVPSRGNFEYCTAVKCDSMCSEVSPFCEQPFIYKGKEIVGCTTMDSDVPWCSAVKVLPDRNDTRLWQNCRRVPCSQVCNVAQSGCQQTFLFNGSVKTGCVEPPRGPAYCPAGNTSLSTIPSPLDVPGSAAKNGVKLCTQTNCANVCYKRADSCQKEWVYRDRKVFGCLTDPILLRGEMPWCSKEVVQNNSVAPRSLSNSWEYCQQIPCSELECEGPLCEGYAAMMSEDGKCWRRDLDGKGIIFSELCRFPDSTGVMIKSVPASDDYFLLKDFGSDSCLQPDGTAFEPNTRIVLGGKCAQVTLMMFRKVSAFDVSSDYFRLQHFSGRCVGLLGSSHILALTADCDSVVTGDLKARLAVAASLLSSVRQRDAPDPGIPMRLYPRPCVWQAWSDWSACTGTCGDGVKYRARAILRHRESGGMVCTGPARQTSPCNGGCPIHCISGDWAPWGPCDQACGGGTRVRAREILVAARFGGRECVDENVTASCNTMPCPVPCQWSAWLEWGSCSSSCGGGVRERVKQVTQQPLLGGVPCGETPKMRQKCGDSPCPIHCAVGGWTDWGQCTATCGGGKKMKKRTVATEPKYGGKNCGDIPMVTMECNSDQCPIDCVFEPWMDWSECALTCGGGRKQRKRFAAREQFQGKGCEGENFQGTFCNVEPCPQDCVWDSWIEWSSCSKSCDKGVMQRSRVVLQESLHGGRQCEGSWFEKRACAEDPCPIDCAWYDWQPWSSCTLSCGSGLQTRVRTKSVLEEAGGKVCFGSPSETAVCNTAECPVECQWYPWSTFGECSRSCGGGLQERLRSRLQIAQFGGLECTGENKYTRECNTFPCRVDCSWDQWKSWSSCTKSCGIGNRQRNRNEEQVAMYGGTPCDGVAAQTEYCNLQTCPIDCVFQAWSEWSACTRSCGDDGFRKRQRDMSTFQDHGGKACDGARTMVEPCMRQGCPTDCTWFPWQEWGDCSATCGGGSRYRERIQDRVALFGGKACSGGAKQRLGCAEFPCKIDCAWGPWTSWSICSKSCGGGKKWRSRVIKTFAEHGGQSCDGDERVIDWCQTNPCIENYFGRPGSPPAPIFEVDEDRNITRFDDGETEVVSLLEDEPDSYSFTSYAQILVIVLVLLGMLSCLGFQKMKAWGSAESAEDLAKEINFAPKRF